MAALSLVTFFAGVFLAAGLAALLGLLGTFLGLLAIAFLGVATFLTYFGVVFFAAAGFLAAGFFAFFGEAFLTAAGFFTAVFLTLGATAFLASLFTLKDPEAPVSLVLTRTPFVTRLFTATLPRKLFFSTSMGNQTLLEHRQRNTTTLFGGRHGFDDQNGTSIT